MEIDGKEHFQRFEKLSLHQPFGGHHQLTIYLPPDLLESADAVGLLDFSNRFIGREIKLSIQHQKKDSGLEFFFRGIIHGIKVTKDASGKHLLVVKGISPTALLAEEANTRSFADMSVKDIATKVVADYPERLLRFDNATLHTTAIAYSVQYEESNFDFLRRLAADYGESFFYDGQHLRFGRIEKSRPQELWLSKDLEQFSLGLQLQPMGFRHMAFNVLRHESFSSLSQDIHLNPIDPLSEHLLEVSEKLFANSPLRVVTTSVGAQKELETKVKNPKEKKAGKFVLLQGKGRRLGIKPGSFVQVHNYSGKQGKETKEAMGEFCVLDMDHFLDNNGDYWNLFTACPGKLVQAPVQKPASRLAARPQLAHVRDNNDPEGLGRVRVQFLWQAENEKTPWIPCTTLSGGNGTSIYFVPETEELVWVGFENDHPEHPFVLGSLYHGKAKPGFDDPGNNLKVIQTRSGNTLSFDDQSGRESIRIANRDGKNEIVLTLGEGGKLCIHSDQKLEFSADTIEFDARNISFKSKQEIALQAKEINAKADQKYSVESTELTLEAKTTAALKSKISVEVSATAEAKIQAGLIKLN